MVSENKTEETITINAETNQVVGRIANKRREYSNGLYYSYSDDFKEKSRALIEWKSSDLIEYTYLEGFYNEKLDEKMAGTKFILNRVK